MTSSLSVWRWVCVLTLLCATISRAQSTSVVSSPHNLSTLGPGTVRAATEEQVCIFCHTPHNATPVQPLWNRDVPSVGYTVYTSNSLQATPGQPTGSSKLCLSCHDGTIALGSVRSRNQPIAMAGGMTTLPPGASNLGTDLSDDHPISFRYDQTLATKNTKIVAPAGLSASLKLDPNSEMQCTTCHDAHNNANGSFLVMSNSNSQLCRSCHLNTDTTVSGHLECASCHQPHSAPSGPYLLKGKTVSQTCLPCHNGASGTPQGPNIAVVMNKISQHDTNVRVNLPSNAPNNIGCSDCHGPHTMQPGTAVAPAISPKLGVVSGINAAGAVVARAQYEYEVCFKCHSNQSVTTPPIARQSAQTDKRLQTGTTALSYHPIQSSIRNTDVPSLRTGLSHGTVMYCNDCHNSDLSKQAGSTGANGPHGSGQRDLLVSGYVTTDRTTESASAYALCYSCHDRNSILHDRSFTKHAEHIVDQRTPCSVCHDPHGVVGGAGLGGGSGTSLINFDLSVVTADPKTKQLKFVSRGTRSGECYLSCHGKAHSPLRC